MDTWSQHGEGGKRTVMPMALRQMAGVPNSGKQKPGLGRTCRNIPWTGRTIQANRECEILTLYSKILVGKSTLSLCAKKRSSDHENPTVLPLGL